MHGKDQLLCPSKNAHRYDVCISREQLCDHVADCPEAEDEDPRQCFFYKPVSAGGPKGGTVGDNSQFGRANSTSPSFSFFSLSQPNHNS